jgi:hypothetical protein
METHELINLLPPSSFHKRFMVVPLDEMLRELYKWCKERKRQWQFIIFNCCDKSQKGQHWLLLILPPSLPIILFDPLGLQYPSLINALHKLRVVNIWNNTRRVQTWTKPSCGLHCIYFIYSFLKRMNHHDSPARIANAVMRSDYSCRSPIQCDVKVARFVGSIIKVY